MKQKITLLFAVFFSLSLGVATAQEISSLPAIAPIPANNTMTASKIKLGKMLFFEPRLSKSNWISCATCHNPAMGFTDRIPLALGHSMKVGHRNTPTILNAAFLKFQFWDGRANTLEEQALGPIQAPVEMNLKLSEAIVRLKTISGYVELFKKSFPEYSDPVNKGNLAKALAAYERTLITPDSPIDRYLSGDTKALNSKAVKGFKKFKSIGCVECHSGSIFSDSDFHRIKVPGSTDLGRYKVTHKEEDKYKFRTPTLRNVTLTWPYMNNGSVATLEEAVKLMGKEALGSSLDNNTAREIVEFLKSLTGENITVTVPSLP